MTSASRVARWNGNVGAIGTEIRRPNSPTSTSVPSVVDRIAVWRVREHTITSDRMSGSFQAQRVDVGLYAAGNRRIDVLVVVEDAHGRGCWVD